jgi:hypothetical protein
MSGSDDRQLRVAMTIEDDPWLVRRFGGSRADLINKVMVPFNVRVFGVPNSVVGTFFDLARQERRDVILCNSELESAASDGSRTQGYDLVTTMRTVDPTVPVVLWTDDGVEKDVAYWTLYSGGKGYLDLEEALLNPSKFANCLCQVAEGDHLVFTATLLSYLAYENPNFEALLGEFSGRYIPSFAGPPVDKRKLDNDFVLAVPSNGPIAREMGRASAAKAKLYGFPAPELY